MPPTNPSPLSNIHTPLLTTLAPFNLGPMLDTYASLFGNIGTRPTLRVLVGAERSLLFTSSVLNAEIVVDYCVGAGGVGAGLCGFLVP
mmetsp:Transcript_2246/g.3322  ORF Transcript_2246/g.3322 Transcript_2246/m.3322 type:complete len:88 (-) Transcript_2246:148-411(-)